MANQNTEFDRARSVQAAMLPQPPQIPGLEIAASYRACDHVGGDFYDFVVVDSWHLGFVMADVSGHGTAAALVMAAAKKTLQMCGRGCLSPRETLLAVNDHLGREIPRGMFVSVFYGVLDVRNGEFIFARAGHNPLPVLRANASSVEWHSPPGPVLGVLNGSQLGEQLGESSIQLAIGDTLVLYTDGLTEAQNLERGMWGEKALDETISRQAGATCNEVVSALLQEVDGFRRGAPQNDDEAIVVLRRIATDVEPAPLHHEGAGHETNLPEKATSLIGRDREVSELLNLLVAGDSPVTTVTGAPGIGKTRVALGASSLALPAYPAGIWFCDLSEISDAHGVRQQIGVTLGVEFSDGKASTRLDNALRGRSSTRGGALLLVLDNCDQCREGVIECLRQLKSVGSGAHVLATSRSPLGVPREAAFPVQPLPTPPRKRTENVAPVNEKSLRELGAMPAVALFVARGRERLSSFELTPENADAVGQLCVRLDGIPLAIELAAARVRVLSPQKMLERLNQRFALLRDQRSDASSRHSTLRGAIEWSWDLLDAFERNALTQLAVFGGGFLLELAEDVVQLPGDAPLVMDVVESLHEKNLVHAKELTDGDRRFFLYESVRAFADEQLEQSGRRDVVTARWRAELVRYSRELWEQRHGKNHQTARARLELELDDLVGIARTPELDPQAAAWSCVFVAPILLRQGRPVVADELVASCLKQPGLDVELTHYLLVTRATLEVRQDPRKAQATLDGLPEGFAGQYDAMMALLRSLQSQNRGPEVRAMVERVSRLPNLTTRQQTELEDKRGTACWMNSEYAEALRCFQNAAEMARRNGDRNFEVSAGGHIGVVHYGRGELDTALKYFTAALEGVRELGDRVDETTWLSNTGLLLTKLGRFEEARESLEHALRLDRELGNRATEASHMNNLALVFSNMDRKHDALRLYEQAYEIDKELGDEHGMASRLANMAGISRELGEQGDSLSMFEKSRDLYAKCGDRNSVAMQEGNIGIVYAAQGRKSKDQEELQKAIRQFKESKRLFAEVGANRHLNFETELAECLWLVGEVDEARLLLNDILNTAKDSQFAADQKHAEGAQKLLKEIDGNGTPD
ncbi:MAG: SpoIIE family protein phosphatase [Planctomycetota bacterium]